MKSCWRGCRENRTLLHCQWECKLVQPLWKTVWRLLKKLIIELPHHPAIPSLAYIQRKPSFEKIHAPPMFTATQFTMAKTWKQPRYSSTEERIKRCGTYIQWNISHKKEQNNAICSQHGWN